jgi:LAO/AO transport system kinase
MNELAARVLAHETRAVARAMRLVDDRAPDFRDLLRELFPHTGKAFVLGVTGNPGAGKSTLCDRLIEAYRKEDKRVGVLCVDPTSPFSGGAILGDRIRMQRHAADPGVFIRSVATRGHLGGLSRSARDLVRIFDASGCDVVLVETVGVGQDELEITRTAHTTLVVMAPGLGDEVQAIKAGILECADVFAVNKADREGADATVRDLELMIALGNQAIVALSKVKGHTTHTAADGHVQSVGGDSNRWTPPIQRCVATRGEGIAELVAAIERHRAFASDTQAGRARRRARLAEEMRDTLREALIDAAVHDLAAEIDEAIRKVDAREIDPYSATDALIEKFRAQGVSSKKTARNDD